MSAAPRTILKLNASARTDGSVSRAFVDRVVARLAGPQTAVIDRDLAKTPPAFVDAAWVDANFTDPAERRPAQQAALAASDALVAELQSADAIVIGAPIYNFGVPAALKAWIDQVARARLTFRYTADGPVGLLTGKKAYVVIASGGVAVGSAVDFASSYLRHVLGFVGITDVEFVVADRLTADPDAAKAKAAEQVAALAEAA